MLPWHLATSTKGNATRPLQAIPTGWDKKTLIWDKSAHLNATFVESASVKRLTLRRMSWYTREDFHTHVIAAQSVFDFSRVWKVTRGCTLMKSRSPAKRVAENSNVKQASGDTKWLTLKRSLTSAWPVESASRFVKASKSILSWNTQPRGLTNAHSAVNASRGRKMLGHTRKHTPVWSLTNVTSVTWHSKAQRV